MIPTIGLLATGWADKNAKKKGGRGRVLTDREQAAMAAMMGGGMMGGPYGLAASVLSDRLRERRDKRYGSGAREIRGGNPYGYSS